MFGIQVANASEIKQNSEEIRVIKQINTNKTITNIYEDGEAELFYNMPPRKITLNKEEQLKLFTEAQSEIEFAFRKKGAHRGATKWKKQ